MPKDSSTIEVLLEVCLHDMVYSYGLSMSVHGDFVLLLHIKDLKRNRAFLPGTKRSLNCLCGYEVFPAMSNYSDVARTVCKTIWPIRSLTNWRIRLTSQQKAQLPLRNRASAMYFVYVAKLLSIAVMTYAYFYHLRNLRLTIQLIIYAHSE